MAMTEDSALKTAVEGKSPLAGSSSLTTCSKGTFGTAAAKNYTTSVTSGSSDLITSGAVYNKLGSTSISSIGDGTVTGAISTLNSNKASTTDVAKKVVNNSYGTHGIGLSYDGNPKMEVDNSEITLATKATTLSGYGITDAVKSRSDASLASLELFSASPFIDFHFGSSSADYTSRIIETSSGTLNVDAQLNVKGNSVIDSGTCFVINNGTITIPVNVPFIAFLKVFSTGSYCAIFASLSPYNGEFIHNNGVSVVNDGAGTYTFSSSYGSVQGRCLLLA